MNNYNPFHNNFDLYVQSFLKKFFFFTLLATPRSALYHSSLTLKVKVLVTHSCPTLCNPMDCSPPGSSVHGVFQARIREWVAIPPPGHLSEPGMEPGSPALWADYRLSPQGQVSNPRPLYWQQSLSHWTTRKAPRSFWILVI